MTLRGGWNPTWIFCGTWWSRRWVTFVLIIKMPRYSEPKCKLIEVQNWMCEKYGILEASITFTYSLMVVNYHIPGILDLKLKHLASFGLLESALYYSIVSWIRCRRSWLSWYTLLGFHHTLLGMYGTHPPVLGLSLTKRCLILWVHYNLTSVFLVSLL